MGKILKFLSVITGTKEEVLLNINTKFLKSINDNLFKRDEYISTKYEKKYIIEKFSKELITDFDIKNIDIDKELHQAIGGIVKKYVDNKDNEFLVIFNRVMVKYYGMKLGDTVSLGNSILLMTEDIKNYLYINSIIEHKYDLVDCNDDEIGNKFGTSFLIKGEWIYTTSIISKIGRRVIYKIKLDGSISNILFECKEGWDVSNINIIGDTLFFTHRKPHYSKLPEVEFIRMNIDGSNIVLLKKLKGHIDIRVVGNSIYYTNNSQDSGSTFDIYKIGTDGKKNRLLYKDAGIRFINNNWIYKYDDNTKIFYRMKTDGREKQGLFYMDKSGWINDINIIGEWVYYMCTDSCDGKGIYKIKIDGSEEIKLVSIEDSFLYLEKMIVSNEWIYYMYKRYDKYEERYYINKIRVDGSELVQLHSISKESNDVFIFSVEFNVDDEWIYYIKTDRYHKELYERIYKLKTDGSDLQEVICFSTNKLIKG